MKHKIHPAIKAAIARVTAKRPKTVVDHIAAHGQITTEELKTLYGYDHPPRAARDVREQGIPLETFRVTGSNGRSIGAYRFGDPSKVEAHKLGGRRVLPRELKDHLSTRSNGKCEICSAPFEERYLQVDHRVPYEVAGDVRFEHQEPADFMLVCGSCQRSKSWSCEHCDNWIHMKSVEHCQTCYWASPDDYEHVALEERRRIDLVWVGDDVENYGQLQSMADQLGLTVKDYIRSLLRQPREIDR